jgi:hypothetical protein
VVVAGQDIIVEVLPKWVALVAEAPVVPVGNVIYKLHMLVEEAHNRPVGLMAPIWGRDAVEQEAQVRAGPAHVLTAAVVVVVTSAAVAAAMAAVAAAVAIVQVLFLLILKAFNLGMVRLFLHGLAQVVLLQPAPRLQ